MGFTIDTALVEMEVYRLMAWMFSGVRVTGTRVSIRLLPVMWIPRDIDRYY